MADPLKLILNRELHLTSNELLRTDPDAVIQLVRANLVGILKSVGEVPENLCLVLLRGSLARRCSGTYSDIDIEAFSLHDSTIIDRVVYLESYLITYYRSLFSEIESELVEAPVAIWHRQGFRDSIVLEDRGHYWDRLTGLIDNIQSNDGPSRSIYLPPLRRLLEYRRKIYNCDLVDTSLYLRYCAYQAAFNFIAFWYAVTTTNIKSEATFYDVALSHLPSTPSEAVQCCLDSSRQRADVVKAVDALLVHSISLLHLEA